MFVAKVSQSKLKVHKKLHTGENFKLQILDLFCMYLFVSFQVSLLRESLSANITNQVIYDL